MTEFKLAIKSGNAAFSDFPQEEVARILKEATAKLERGIEDGYCIDINGNKVGEWYFLADEEN